MTAKGGQSRTVSARVARNCVICVHSAGAPSKEEWEHILSLFAQELAHGRLRVLVWTEGGAPDTNQRARLRELLGQFSPRIAVLSSSPLVRAAGTALSWFIPQLRLFSPDALVAALDHLEIAAHDREPLRQALEESRAELHDPSRRASLRG